MRSDPFDFNVFQSRVLLSQRRHAPLQDNLRKLMASVLGKAIDYSGYSSVLHVFVNQSLGEAHVMGLSRGTPAWDAVEECAMHRERQAQTVDSSSLPSYWRLTIPEDSRFFAGLSSVSDPYPVDDAEDLLESISRLGSQLPEDLAEFKPAPGEKTIAVPLARHGFRRLGALLFHSGSFESARSDLRGPQGEAFVEFGLGVSRLLVQVFGVHYGMHPNTYLPSYHCPQHKKVALLSAEIRHFDFIARTLDARHEMRPEQRRACLRELVNHFSETVADVVEKYRGRLDQLWGGGLIAVFGEYLDAPGDAQVSSCMRAVQAAAEAVKRFAEAKKSWLEDHFLIAEFKEQWLAHITTALAVAVSLGDVEFDYLGSCDHRRYMTFGDHVSFIKELTKRACRTELDDEEDSERLEPPILVTQPVFVLVHGACIHDRPGAPVGSVERKVLVRLPERPAKIPIYPLWPDNVDTNAV